MAEIHLNQIDPQDLEGQDNAFKAGGLSVAVLLNHRFVEERYRKSRELDPIVGVSFTGLFDFFVKAFGVDWLRWWEAGRRKDWGEFVEYWLLGDLWDVATALLPAEMLDDSNPEGFYYWQQSRVFLELEKAYLERWRKVAHEAVWDYCDRHKLKRPNRCTTVQPSGTKSLLTGASPGWHPPKAQRFIRRITCSVDDPVAKACLKYGYSVVPGQSDKDENGALLTDPLDPRVTEWLVEIPCQTIWADQPGAEEIDISKFNATSQLDFYMQVQKHYTTHNTSATWELREHEIEEFSDRIYQAIQNDEGYISGCILARFDDKETYPRLPFEPISKEVYDAMVEAIEQRREIDDFREALSLFLDAAPETPAYEQGGVACEGVKCLLV